MTCGACDVGALVTGQLGHKYAGELYGIHIGSALKLTLFNGERAWDLSGGQPVPDGIPDQVRQPISRCAAAGCWSTAEELVLLPRAQVMARRERRRWLRAEWTNRFIAGDRRPSGQRGRERPPPHRMTARSPGTPGCG